MRRVRPFWRFHALTLALPVALVVAGCGTATAGATPPFLSHQALYELSLLKARGNVALNGVRGRILYSFSGSACEGYSSEFRQVSELDSGEGKNVLSDLRSTSWEDGDAKSYRFKIETKMNDTDPSVVDGVAERDGDHITVKLKQPVAKNFSLEGTPCSRPSRSGASSLRRSRASRCWN